MITLEQKVEEFKKVCKVINLMYEYKSCDKTVNCCIGNIEWGIISTLPEDELLLQFADVVNEYYSPYILLTPEQGAVIVEYNNNEWKHKMRSIRCGHVFDIHDNEFEEHHPEIAIEREPIDKIILKDSIEKLREELSSLKEVQKRRTIKYFFYDMTLKEIAEEECVSHFAVKCSVDIAIKNLKKFLI